MSGDYDYPVDHYRAYIFLLRKLHKELFNPETHSYRKDTSKANAIRDEMDEHWYYLSKQQTTKARLYSERLWKDEK
jgi:hypothetical protein